MIKEFCEEYKKVTMCSYYDLLKIHGKDTEAFLDALIDAAAGRVPSVRGEIFISIARKAITPYGGGNFNPRSSIKDNMAYVWTSVGLHKPKVLCGGIIEVYEGDIVYFKDSLMRINKIKNEEGWIELTDIEEGNTFSISIEALSEEIDAEKSRKLAILSIPMKVIKTEFSVADLVREAIYVYTSKMNISQDLIERLILTTQRNVITVPLDSTLLVIDKVLENAKNLGISFDEREVVNKVETKKKLKLETTFLKQIDVWSILG